MAINMFVNSGESWLARDGAVTPDSPMPNSQPDGAMNDTGKIKKTRSCTDQGKNLSESVTAPAASVHDLQQVCSTCGFQWFTYIHIYIYIYC